ncbi:MAG TPA: class I SAM-dependent methyltransferase [Vicinamibacterales bacterium]|nr:class I SAM-dependent methyltransferase [Vicinamibacterales bacterium]
MPAEQTNGRWADRAASLYDADYARRYRDRDDALLAVPSNRALIDWLGAVCDRFDRPIEVLDLGCGTGRYFWGLRNVSRLTGLDASAAMLDEARQPIHPERLDGVPIALIQGDVMTHAFAPASFDLVYSIGVLAEHVPFDRSVVERVAGWLRPGGRFAFTTVHPESPSVPLTPQRRVASMAVAALPQALTGALHARLVAGGLYGDERWIRTLLAGRFAIESLDRFTTDVHLHGRCVAVKP